jgi:serine/threonine protein kinase
MHRDVKPDNFLIGVGENETTIYVIDFGLAKHYCNPKDGTHIPHKDKKSLTGTARYASLNTHNGIEQSRRDDLECLGYVMIYFMKGSLPWQGLQAKDRKEKYEKIKAKKAGIPIEKLCEGIPDEFTTYIKYCRSLKFEEAPNYAYVRKLFEDLFNTEKYSLDYQFDWVILKNLKKGSDNEAIKLMVKNSTEPNHNEEKSKVWIME